MFYSILLVFRFSKKSIFNVQGQAEAVQAPVVDDATASVNEREVDAELADLKRQIISVRNYAECIMFTLKA